MQTQAFHPLPTFDGRHAAPATPLSAWPRQILASARTALARWNERRRVQREYRRDLALLAGLGERELADFGAPGWLRADVQRYR